MRLSGMRAAVALVALLLCVTGAAWAAPVSEAAAQDPADGVLQDGGADSLGTERRLVDRESSERVDAAYFGLISLAVGMSVMLVIFLWHTSPRRRLRLSRERSDSRLGAPAGSDGGRPRAGLSRFSRSRAGPDGEADERTV